MAGDQKAISASAKRGWSLFNGKGRCMSCHGWNPTQPMFTDNRFTISASRPISPTLCRWRARRWRDHRRRRRRGAARSAGDQSDMSGVGRFLVTKDPHDIGAFRTMGLRNLLVTQPYFHDGSQVTLWDTIDHYNKGGVRTRSLTAESCRSGSPSPKSTTWWRSSRP